MAVLLVLAGGVRAWGQDAATGAIAGVALNSDGVAMAGAEVVARDVATAVERVGRCGGGGEFAVVGLAPGRYEVGLRAAGYSGVTREVVVEVGGTSTIDLRTGLGWVRTTVEVDAGEDRTEAALTEVVTPGEMEGLPLNGLEWQQFVLLTPVANEGEVEGGPVSFRGEPETQNATVVDGVSGDQSYGGVAVGAGAESGTEAEDETDGEPADEGGRPYAAGGVTGRHAGAAFVFSREAVREFRVNAHGYSALYGHAAGGVVAAVSRGGEDGTARERVLDAAGERVGGGESVIRW